MAIKEVIWVNKELNLIQPLITFKKGTMIFKKDAITS